MVIKRQNEGGIPYKNCQQSFPQQLIRLVLLPNEENVKLVLKFHEFMKENSASERHQNNNLKAILAFSNYFGQTSLKDIDKKEDVLSFLQSKIKDKEQDPEQKWITTYNDYLHRIKHFYRWLYNGNGTDIELSMDLWKTPVFMESLKPKKTKRLSPYSETEIWDKDEFLSIIKYEPFQRNKAALALLWDLDARPHEITLLKIKHIRLKKNMEKEKYLTRQRLAQVLFCLLVLSLM